MEGNNKIKIEYAHGTEKRVVLWETGSNGILETMFDGNGYILLQRVAKLDGNALNARVSEVLKNANISETIERPYKNVEFPKPCPKCGKHGLSRYVEAFASKGEAPVMPLYYCSSCRTKSYYLTESYLDYLVENNLEMFNEKEIKEMKEDKTAFVEELRGYIIRIFASKKIMCID